MRNPIAGTCLLRRGFIWAAFAAAALLPSAARAECSGVLEGEVLDVERRQPISGARVMVPAQVRVAESGAGGRYRLEGLCPGVFRVEVEKPGYSRHVERFGIHDHTNQHDFFLTPFDLGQVDIRARELNGADREAHVVETLDGEALARTRGLDLGRSLQALTGVQVIGSGAVSKPVVNGFTGQRLLILNDGVRHESQDWSLDHGPEIDPFSAGKLQVIKGAAGVRFGPDALGGVILLEPPPYPEEPGLSGEATLVGFANGFGGAGALSMQAALPRWFGDDGPQLFTRGQASLRKQGTLRTPRYFLANTGQEEANFGGALRAEWDAAYVEASADFYQTNYGIFFGIGDSSFTTFQDQLDAELPFGSEFFRFDLGFERPFVSVKHLTTRLEAGAELSDAVRVDLRYAFQRDDRREFDQVQRRFRDRPQATFELDTHEAEVAGTVSTGPLETELGLTYQHQVNGFFGANPFIPDYVRNAGGAFAQTRWVADRVALDAGVRVDLSRYRFCVGERSSFAEGLPTSPACEPDEREAIREFSAVTFGVGGIFELADGWTFRTNLGSAVRNPAPNELFVNGVSSGLAALERGDPDLDNEITYNLQGQIEYQGDRTAFSASAYTHYVDGYIYAGPVLTEDGIPVAPLTNRGRFPLFQYAQIDAVFAGIDAEAAVRPFPWMELKTQLSLIRGEDLTNDRFVVFVPPDSVRTRLTLAPPGTVLGSDYVYAESQVVLQQTRFDLDADFAEPPPSYHLLNVGLGTTFEVSGQPFRLQVEIRNLGNEVYRDYLSRLRYYADEPGLQGFLRLQMPFETRF
jgi:iron complex outermembrane receptor protein